MEKVAIAPARVMRIVWFGFIFVAVMLIYLAIRTPALTRRPIDPTVEMILTIVALVDVVLGFLMPRILRRYAKRARERQTGSAALNAWLRNSFLGLVYVYSCNLLAFILHCFKARTGLVEPLFGVGMVSLLLWRPGTPPVLEAGNLPQS